MANQFNILFCLGLMFAIQGCTAGRAVGDGALRAVGMKPDNLNAEATEAPDGDHWSEEWVWKGDGR